MALAIYKEDGGKYLVTVLSDETTDTTDFGPRKRREVKMRVERELIKSPIHASMLPGYEYSVMILEGHECYLTWELEYLAVNEPQPIEPIYSGPTATDRDSELGVEE
jgi:hypothetical protein